MSERYAQFCGRCAARLQAAFPGKLLGQNAYGGILHPTFGAPLKDNVYVRICGRPNMLSEIAAWSRKAKRLGVYEYVYGTVILEPRHYPHVLGEYVKMLVREYRIPSFSAEVMPFWPFDTPKFYVLSELLWDIDQDINDLLTDYFESFYQESAHPMMAFFQRMEDVYRRREDPHYFFDGYRRGGFFGWKLPDLEYMDARLEDAKQLARHETVRARIRIVDEAYQHVKCWINVYIYTSKLAGTEIGSTEDIEQTLKHARAIYGNMAERREWDRRVLDRSRYPSDESYYKFYVPHHYANPGTSVQTETQAEDEVEAAFERIAKWPGWREGELEALWRRLAKERHGLSALAKTQMRLLRHRGKLDSLFTDGDFEGATDVSRPMPKDLLHRYRWRRIKDLPTGYSAWSYTGRPATFVWTDKLAHSGRRCIGIESNEVKASINRPVAVKSGERYRISVLATRVWQGKGAGRDIHPHLTVAWQGKKGWTQDARLIKDIKVPVSGSWQEAIARVTVPANATKMVIMLGVNGSQLGAGGTHFDDLRVWRTYDGM